MRTMRVALFPALLCFLAVSIGPAAKAGADADLEQRLTEQAALIEQLSQQLAGVREEQLESDERVLALEDQLVGAQALAGVATDYVQRDYEAFEMTPKNRLFLSGYGTATLSDAQNGARDFGTNFNPVFHFRLNERLHFMGELEIELEEGDSGTDTEVELEIAQIDFMATDALTVSAGKVFLPFNTFGPRTHPQWINKLASAPPIYGGHGSSGLIPILSEVGAMVSGGTSLWGGRSTLNYAAYVSAGPSFDLGHGHGNGADAHDDGAGHDDEGEPHDEADVGHDDEGEHPDEGEVGQDGEGEHPDEGEQHDEGNLTVIDATTNPSNVDDIAFGGRLGFLPIENLEIGASFMSGRASSSEDHFDMVGFDAWYYLGGLELRAEYARLNRTRGVTIPDGYGYYVQAAYRNRDWAADTGIRGVLSRLEPVIRWGEVEDADELNLEQFAFGLNYWLYESVPIKLAYELNDGADDDNRFIVQFAYGF